MSYERMGEDLLEYYPCRYGASKALFRGPKRRLDKPYIAFIGGSEVYGRYVEFPFPDLVEEAIGKRCVNLGQMNAGLDLYLNDDTVLDIARNSDATVIQAMPAHNMSNRFYHVHPRRNDRFLKPSALMETLFQEVDFSEFHFTRHMLLSLRIVSPDKFRMIMEELQSAWVARMRLLLTRIPGPKVLLVLPDDRPRQLDRDLGPEPLFVTPKMIEQVEQLADVVVQYSPTDKRAEVGTDGMVYPEMDRAVAEELLPPACHEDIAAELIQVFADD